MENVDLCSHHIWNALAKNLLLMKLNVPVMHRWSYDHAIQMDYEHFLAKVWLALSIYFSFVWTISIWFWLKIRLSGMLWLSTRNTKSCKHKRWASFFAASGISILPVIFMGFLKSILWKSFCPRWWVQVNVSSI